jgi:hypothetical protein
MGGFGSGRQGSLPVIEDGLKLDLRRLRKQGQFIPGVTFATGKLVWSNTHSGEEVANIGYSFCSSGEFPWFRVQYTTTPRGGEPQSIDEKFELERFPQPLGGYRWYFICLQTGKRAQCLYLPPGATRFRSRHGFRVPLQYRSQCEDRSTRLISQMHKVAYQVLDKGTPEWRAQVRDWDFPPKPPGMHWRTYNSLEAKYDWYDTMSAAAIGDRFGLFG